MARYKRKIRCRVSQHCADADVWYSAPLRRWVEVGPGDSLAGCRSHVSARSIPRALRHCRQIKALLGDRFREGDVWFDLWYRGRGRLRGERWVFVGP